MKKKRKLNSTGKWGAATAVIVIVFFLSVIFTYYAMLYSETRERIIKSGELSALSSAEQIDKYLSSGIDIIRTSSYVLDNMLRDGRSREDIHDYLTSQSPAIISVMSGNTAGLYGYINGEYIDGLDWQPEEGYDPTVRPWYTGPRASIGRVAVVDPYLDLDSMTIMVAFGKTLCDAKSVVAIDFSMAPLQAITERLAMAGDSDMAIVLDRKYQVIAHSDASEVGKSYAAGSGTLGGALVEGLRAADKDFFSVRFDGADYIVYTVPVANNWVCLSVCNATSEFRQLQQTLIFTAFASLFVIFVLLLLMRYVSRKNRIAQELMENLSQAENHIKEKEGQIGEISKVAFRDALTGVGSKAAFDQLAGELSQEVAAGRTEASVVMVDVNNLKQVNDSCGHDAGDKYLRGCCKIICEVYKHSPVFRIGGDEFAVVLRNGDHEDRASLLLLLRETFEKTYAHRDRPAWERYSAAAGMAECTAGDTSLDQALKRADTAMYVAKQAFKAERGRAEADEAERKPNADDHGAEKLPSDALSELTRARQEMAETKAAFERAQSARDLYARIAQALSASYFAVYYVETETGDYVSYQQNKLGDQVGTDFFGSSKVNFAPAVVEEDRESFCRELDRENVMRALAEYGEISVNYRIMSGGEILYCKTHIAPMPGDPGHLLVGISADRNIDVRNELTGLHTEAALLAIGGELLRANPDWCVFAIDLEHFKLFNEWYGRDKGDELLAQIGELLTRVEKTTGGLSCYLGQDDFALVTPYDPEKAKQLFGDIHEFVIEYGTSVGFMPAIGVCFADGKSSVQELLDRALQAAQYAKENYHQRIRVFEEAMYQKTEQDYQILSDFQQALTDRELFIQLQPQCLIDSGKIMGAESLVRWRKADGKVVSPGVFVPVLEQYGFVTDLDQFVWEEVCAWQRKWIDAGHTPLPISVNVSQIDIFTIDVPSHFELLIWKYKLPVDVIKIEITESAYVGDEKVADTVRRLREKGFVVLMDDFGSGYSSLNMLRSLNVDVIKLDAQFLRMNSDDQKGVRILESIVAMAKSMEAPIIVEGVETAEETEFIKSLGCRYVQGYYFYRPMPVADFEALITDESNIDTDGFVL